MREIIAWMLVGILLCLLAWQCNTTPKSSNNTAAIDSLNKEISIRDIRYSADSAKWAEDAARQDEIIRSLTQSKEELQQALTGQIVQLTFQRNKYRTAAEAKDTAAQLQACDQFILLADSFYTKAVVYEATIDSLLTAHRNQHVTDSSVISMLMKDREEGKKQTSALQHFLEDSVAENLELRKAMAKNKKGRWILAAIAAGVGGVIGHQIK